jgi:uncharacterized membrane protein
MGLESDVYRLEFEIRSLRENVRKLAERIYALENAAGSVEEPRPAKPAEPPVTVAAAPAAATAKPLVREEVPPPAVEPAVPPPAEPAAGPGWEAILGGSWLNKVGVLVLVIGLALFMWYSYGKLGPGGRVAVSLAVSAAMLGAGVILERREKYRVAARGLIGGGWAALYSTTYAAHAIEAARIITDPAVGTLLLAAVAAGMILHSLRYRSQVVTGLAYFVAFVTLAISPLTFFVLIALMPLAVSFLYLAHRFGWSGMALVGLPATYGIYFLQAARSSGGTLAAGQAILLAYWLIFEVFDVLYAVRTRSKSERPCPVFPLNALGFLGASFALWQALSPGTLYQLFVLAAAAYLGSSLLRIMLLPPSGFPEEDTVLDRVKQGGYEGAMAVAAALTAVAISLKLSGLSVSVAFLIEAELLFFAGLYYRQSFLRHLATALLGVSAARLIAIDVPGSGQMTLAGRTWHAWSPVALLHSGVFYLNRFLAARGAYYGHAAAALLMLVLGFELPLAFVGLGWLLLALALGEFGARKRLRDFTLQRYWVGAASLVMLVIKNVLDTGIHTDWHGWAPQVCGALLLYGASVRFALRGESESARNIASVFGAVLMAAFLRNTLPPSLTAIGWALLSLALLIAGSRLRRRDLSVQSCILAAVTFVRAWSVNLQLENSLAGLPERVLSAAAVILSFYAAEFLSPRPQPGVGGPLQWIDVAPRFLYSWLATALLSLLLFYEVSGSLLTVALGVQGLLLLFAGFPLRERCLRISGLALLLACVLKLFFYDLRQLELPFRILSFLVLGVILIGVSFIYSRFRERISKYL